MSSENLQDPVLPPPPITPEPPKPPRSAFICFSDAKQKQILAERRQQQQQQPRRPSATGADDHRPEDYSSLNKADVLNLVADEWKQLSDRERAYWDEEARNDKVRFVREKAEYKGPWNLPKRRAKKHPLAPKRPMSAFLKFSQKRRPLVKKNNPHMSNTDVSRLLGEMWRNANPSERAPYIEQEELERTKYKDDIKKWREDQAQMDAASRTSHHSVQQQQRPEEKTTPAGSGASRYWPGANHPSSPERGGNTPHHISLEPVRLNSGGGGARRPSDRTVFRAYRGPIGDATNRAYQHPSSLSSVRSSAVPHGGPPAPRIDPSKDERHRQLRFDATTPTDDNNNNSGRPAFYGSAMPPPHSYVGRLPPYRPVYHVDASSEHSQDDTAQQADYPSAWQRTGSQYFGDNYYPYSHARDH